MDPLYSQDAGTLRGVEMTDAQYRIIDHLKWMMDKADGDIAVAIERRDFLQDRLIKHLEKCGKIRDVKDAGDD